MKRRILIDGRKLGDGGIGVYIENLIDGLLALADSGRIDVALTVLVRPETLARIDFGASECFALQRWKAKVSFVADSSPRYSFQEYCVLPLRHRELIAEHDIFHSPHYTLPFFLKIPAVATIHDIIHVSHPDTPFHRPVARKLVWSAMRRAQHIVTVSARSAEMLAGEFPAHGAPVTIVHNAVRIGIDRVDDEIIRSTLRRLQVEIPYVLFVGSDRPHKGFRLLVDAWLKLREELAEVGIALPVLAVVGNGFSERTKRYVTQLGLDPWVKFLGDVSTDDLAALYSGTAAVALPSQEEGFGFVALEAMTCGAPVVATPLESVREICGDTAFFSAQWSVGSFASAMMKVLCDHEAAGARAAEGLQRAQAFRRERFAEHVWNVYQAVWEGRHEPVSLPEAQTESKPQRAMSS